MQQENDQQKRTRQSAEEAIHRSVNFMKRCSALLVS